ncbi:hypothetical protein [Luteolibacter sp. LG18]|uniref:hypothetical protein n=1 Tax=Luteolibacter sp. LG18 TaxID=2819286 RepID=UPI002B297B96|nr:hypothetical protein llg_38970 [Luteolibacter sp. LG18]
MKTRPLAPEFRTNLKQLLQGFAEHCEISERLAGRIEHPIYFHGFKFGSPVFTFQGPSSDGSPPRTIGLLAHNTPTSTVASDILLQLIEVATLRPEIAVDQIFRVLPVSDPVTLELGEEAPDLSGWPVLGYVLDQFRESVPDGLIEIRPTSGNSLVIGGTSDVRLFQVLASNVGKARGLPSPPLLSSFVPAFNTTRWHLEVEVPETWTQAGDVLAVSRFIGRVLETYSHLLGACRVKARRLS